MKTLRTSTSCLALMVILAASCSPDDESVGNDSSEDDAREGSADGKDPRNDGSPDLTSDDDDASEVEDGDSDTVDRTGVLPAIYNRECSAEHPPP